MALLWIDGFDHYDVPSEKYIDLTGTNCSLGTSIKRTGIQALSTYRDGGVAHELKFNAASVIAGVAFYQPSTSATTRCLFDFWVGGSRAGMVTIEANIRRIDIRSQGVIPSTEASSSAGIFEFDTWHFIEVKFTPGNAGVGSVEVKLDGDIVVSDSSGDYQPGGTTAVDTVRIGGYLTQNVNTYFDDLYIADETGADNNDYLGDCVVRHFHPVSDGSISSGFSRLSGSSDTSAVNEASADGDVSYLYASATGAEVSFNFENHSGSETIYGVAVTSVGKQAVSGSTRQITNIAYSSGTSSAGPSARVLPNDYRGRQSIWDNDPDTGTAWTLSGFNSAEFGTRLAV